MVCVCENEIEFRRIGSFIILTNHTKRFNEIIFKDILRQFIIGSSMWHRKKELKDSSVQKLFGFGNSYLTFKPETTFNMHMKFITHYEFSQKMQKFKYLSVLL